MSDPRYRFVHGSQVSGVTADQVGDELEAIHAKIGYINPEQVLLNASKEDSILHDLFEWDDAKAAHEYRVDQARYLIRSVELIIPERKEQKVRAFVKVGERMYYPVQEALSDKSMRETVLKRARRDLDSWQRRYQHLEEFADVVCAIRQALNYED